MSGTKTALTFFDATVALQSHTPKHPSRLCGVWRLASGACLQDVGPQSTESHLLTLDCELYEVL